jgi:hypothetical protein
MLIIDSPLITDYALIYFIPRLARAVIEESGNAYLFLRRLKKIDPSRLSGHQNKLLKSLISVCFNIEKQLDI